MYTNMEGGGRAKKESESGDFQELFFNSIFSSNLIEFSPSIFQLNYPIELYRIQ